MGVQGKTRLANRIKRFSSNLKKVDQDKRKSIIADKLNYLESDYYEEPNRLAEDNDSDDFKIDGEGKPISRKEKIQKRILKKIKKQSDMRKNFNLMKIIKDQAMYDKNQPNFVTIKVKPSRYPPRKYCSICGNLSKSSCTRCGERVCRLKCWRTHSEIKCLNFQLQY